MTIERAGIIPHETLGDRLRMALREGGLGVQEVADLLQVNRNTVSRWINDRGTPDRRTLLAWSFATGVDRRWLETGEAPAEPGPRDGARTGGLEPPTFWSVAGLGAVA